MADQLETPNPSPSGSSEPIGRSLDGFRGVNPRFEELDEENIVPEGSEAAGQETEAEVDHSAEAQGATSEEAPETGSGDQLDDEVKALQKRLLESDKDRTRRAQEVQFLKGKLTELDPYTRLGLAIEQHPGAYEAVQKVLSGEQLTPAEKKSVSDTAEASGLSAKQLMAQVSRMMQSEREAIRKDVRDTLAAHEYAVREFEKLSARARKELPNFDALQEHPGFLGWVGTMQAAIKNGTQLVPEGVDENFYALKLAHDAMIASNPEYIELVRKVGVKQGKESVAKKMAAAGPGSASRGSTSTKTGSVDQGAKDRLGMLRAWHGNNSARRLPGAR